MPFPTVIELESEPMQRQVNRPAFQLFCGKDFDLCKRQTIHISFTSDHERERKKNKPRKKAICPVFNLGYKGYRHANGFLSRTIVDLHLGNDRYVL